MSKPVRHFIRDWRKYRGLTQTAFAEKIGIGRSYVAKIETGSRRYDQPFLEAAANVLACTPADLISRSPTDPEELSLILARMSPQDRLRAAAVLKAMLAD